MPTSDVFIWYYWVLAIKTFPGAIVLTFFAGVLYALFINYVSKRSRRGAIFVGHADNFTVEVQAQGRYTVPQCYALVNLLEMHISSASKAARHTQ